MPKPFRLQNRGVLYHYEVIDKYVAGLELLGLEVKSLRAGRGNLAGSYVSVQGNELFLIKCAIPPYQPKNTAADYDEERPRRLLLKRSEIKYLTGKLKEKGLAVVPLAIFSQYGLIKIELALAKGLKQFEKRDKLKKRDFEREVQREIKK